MKRGFATIPGAAACALVVVALTGCSTELTIEKINNAALPKKPGFTYYLSKHEIRFDVTYRLAQCPMPIDKNDKNSKLTGSVVIDQKVAISVVQLRDGDEQYQVNYEDLLSAFKTTTITVETYETGVLKRINAIVDDRTADVIKGFTAGAISIAKMAAFSTKDKPDIKPLCNDTTMAVMDRLKGLSKSLMEATIADKARDAARDAIGRNTEFLTVSRSFTYEPKRDVKLDPITLSPPLTDFSHWFIPNLGQGDIDEIQPQTRTQVTFEVLDPVTDQAALKPGPINKGIVYRAPGRLSLRACSPTCKTKTVGPAVLPNTDEGAAIVSIGQLGRYQMVSLENGPFEKNNIELFFAEDGSLKTATVGEESSLSRAAASFADTTSQVGAYISAREAAEKAAREEAASAELKRLKAQTDILKAKADLIEAQRRLDGLVGVAP